MSYEGYDVYYCSKGHRVTQISSGSFLLDFEREEELKCEVCGEKAILFDSVDLTNGCYCEDLTKEEIKEYGKCPAHETVEKVIGWDSVQCSQCQGTGKHKIVSTWGWKPCTQCSLETKGCTSCKDLKEVPTPGKSIEIQCPCCHGRGSIQVEIWDISHLLEQARKREEEDAKFREKNYCTVSVKDLKDKGCWEEFYKEEQLDYWDNQEDLNNPEMKYTLSEEQAEKYGFIEDNQE